MRSPVYVNKLRFDSRFDPSGFPCKNVSPAVSVLLSPDLVPTFPQCIDTAGYSWNLHSHHIGNGRCRFSSRAKEPENRLQHPLDFLRTLVERAKSLLQEGRRFSIAK
jgi:hypothetical protein